MKAIVFTKYGSPDVLELKEVEKPTPKLAHMKELFDAGTVVPVIDGPYTLSEVPQAFRHFGAGRHKGKVVISMDE